MSKPALPGPIKAIVFDLDGTLYQDDRLGEQVSLAASRYIADLRGISIEQAEVMLEAAREQLSGAGKTLSRAVESLGGTLPELHERLSRDVHPEGILKEDPAVTDLLRRLGEHCELHVYTNNNRELSGRILAEIGLAHAFRSVFTIEDSWHPKPDKEALLDILKAVGTQPAETLFVGDRFQVDLALPEKLGCPVYESRTIKELLSLAQLLETDSQP
jgi:putative hydrolase of the HAD superfamily